DGLWCQGGGGGGPQWRRRGWRREVRGAEKITSGHRERSALIYVRQSSLAQVRDNTESTARQDGLAEEAVRLGWARSAVEGIDADLGLSGRSAEHRSGYKELVGGGGLGGGGAILGVGGSRARVGACFGPRGLPPAPLLGRLVPPAGAGPPHRHAGGRRRRHLRPGQLQRPAPVGPEGHDVRGRAALVGRPAPGRQAGRGRAGRAALPAAGRLRLRRRWRHGDGPWRRGG